MSPTTPPPSATTQASRFRRASISASNTRSSTASVLYCSPSGSSIVRTRLPARPASRRVGVQRTDRCVRDDEDVARRDVTGDQVRVVEQAFADHDRVAAIAQVDLQRLWCAARHGSSPSTPSSRQIWSTTVFTLRPSVSTTISATSAVEGCALFEQAFERAARVVVVEQRPVIAAPGAGELLVHGRPKIHDTTTGAQALPRAGVEDGPAARRDQHPVAAADRVDDLGLAAAGSPPRPRARRCRRCRRPCGPRFRRRCR